MVDYTKSHTTTGGSSIGFFVAAGIVVLVLLYALFAGGSVNTTTDPATIGAEGTAPAVEETAPVAPMAPATE